MDCRKLIVLFLFVAVNCKVIRLEEHPIVNGESMVEVVQRLVREVTTLKTDNQKFKLDSEKLKADDQKLKDQTERLKVDSQKLKTDNEKLKVDSQKLKVDNEKLKADCQKLKTDDQKLKVDSEKLKSDNKELKAEVSRLKNNGYSQFSVADQQWQSLHMAAAAACRASTALGGHGPVGNAVYPRISKQTCDQVCKSTKYFTECDASLSISGRMGRVKTVLSAGSFYNYHCNSPGWSGQVHEETAADANIVRNLGYYGFCCCRKP